MECSPLAFPLSSLGMPIACTCCWGVTSIEAEEAVASSLFDITITSKLKNLNFRKGYRDCIKRSGDKAWMQSTHYIVTSCHGNDDKMWSTSCLIIQHKPYIVELSFMETQKSINEGPSITMEGPFQTNAVLVPLHDVTCRNHWTEFKSDIKLYTPYPCHLSHSLALLHIL